MSKFIGHQERWNALARAFKKERVPQTLLIAGPPGVGKSTLVLHYARLLLCPNVAPDENGLPAPCGACRVCHQVEIETFPDFRAYRPIVSATEKSVAPEHLDSSVITVETARAFADEAMRKPTSGPRKVLVMHQFDRVNEAAQNALLKTLEEPPPGTFLVLTTENAKRLRETILSRCWLLPLTPAPAGEIENWLREQFPGAKLGAIETAIRASQGRPGTARRALERTLESGGEKGRTRFEIAREFVVKLDRFGPVGALRLSEEAQALATQWWEEDAGEADLSKLGAKGSRAAVARFLDELTVAGRAAWLDGVDDVQKRRVGAARLDLIRQTRQHILRNAGLGLALDVMFSRLIDQRLPSSSSGRSGKNAI